MWHLLQKKPWSVFIREIKNPEQLPSWETLGKLLLSRWDPFENKYPEIEMDVSQAGTGTESSLYVHRDWESQHRAKLYDPCVVGKLDHGPWGLLWSEYSRRKMSFTQTFCQRGNTMWWSQTSSSWAAQGWHRLLAPAPRVKLHGFCAFRETGENKMSAGEFTDKTNREGNKVKDWNRVQNKTSIRARHRFKVHLYCSYTMWHNQGSKEKPSEPMFQLLHQWTVSTWTTGAFLSLTSFKIFATKVKKKISVVITWRSGSWSRSLKRDRRKSVSFNPLTLTLFEKDQHQLRAAGCCELMMFELFSLVSSFYLIKVISRPALGWITPTAV